MAALRLAVTVLDAALDPAAAMWGDATEEEQAPALEWVCSLAAAAVPVRGIATPEHDDGDGLLVVPDAAAWQEELDTASRRRRPIVTGAPPADFSERLTTVRAALGALVRPDLRGLLLLRVDDPGASIRQHHAKWRHDPPPRAAWDALWAKLEGLGRVSVFCCPGWVEDDGAVVQSRERSAAEWKALDAGVAAGVADLECHGYTHMYPDTAAWAQAADKHTSLGWFRELWSPLDRAEPTAEYQAELIARWQNACGRGTTLVAPGEAWGTQTVRAARARGLELFNSWSVCRLQTPVPTWARGVASPYLDEVDASWFHDGLPVVACWHDRDMALEGPEWVPRLLDAWREAGAVRVAAFSDLASVYRSPVNATLERGNVSVRSAPDVPLLIERT